jgi:hypothetical protein
MIESTRARPLGRLGPGILRSLLEALAIAVVFSAIALLFNSMRSSGLPLIAKTPYQILVPCPEPGGPVEAVQPSDFAVLDERTYLVDARSRDEWQQWHLETAVNLEYDWLDPVAEEDLLELARNIASSGAQRVVVYGDGGNPDSGEFLGKEISGRGIKNVHYVTGGAPALVLLEGR